ncbi:MAG: DegV family protein [Anaerolineales bacterium]
MPIGIVTDSTCDLPPEVVREHKIAVIPILVHVGSQEYRDGVDLSRERFYSELPGMKPSPSTAAPGVDVFRQTYERLATEGATEILSIHISHRLSATVDVARLAAQATAAARVTVFDSRQLSLGMGFEVHSAARAAGAGRSMAEILSLLEDQISRTHTFAALDTLEYMRRGGRMNPAIAALGGVLQIKPILKMYDGVPTAERVRTRSKAIRRVKELLARHAPFDNVAVVHTGAEARAKELLEEVRGQLPQRDIWVREISPVLGAHIGPGVVGFACLSERR